MTRLNGEPTLELAIAEYDPLWRKLKETPVQLRPAVFNPHDFALTPRFFLFFQASTQALPACCKHSEDKRSLLKLCRWHSAWLQVPAGHSCKLSGHNCTLLALSGGEGLRRSVPG